ncbi:MAG: YdiU family protein [Rhizobiales bacterium]|nr:YdiU family protein [Hyphomicrobiales bacterium]MBO6698369.1 YdiU family protein [Hyphomicrobiales bacterium]MBO6735377.1 YdiU family protein [Hyphomicrobiales bacterium]MBO6910815.1 YdiU family protein [Hyphomicrobiales bacterium]MBO6957253.1 YdiU family protein [Hyphomicrobiales bacterium]
MSDLSVSEFSPFPTYDTSYARLPSAFYAPVQPYGASAPQLLKLNAALAEVLGFSVDALDDDTAANMFAGNKIAEGSQPLAMAYAGHQFGGFNPGLGDGRALLLGEVIGTDGQRYDVQLKGSGQTPFSRQGDGRAALGPVLREYVMSEAMAALGIPTTRALAAITTGDPVLRERVLPGAMVTRVASSHLRVGTFEYAAFRGDTELLSALVDYALDRHGHEDDVDGPPALQLLHAVIDRQAKLIARWMGVGFIHGVMNTDNCTISGETIDYGPCAFMDGYNPAQVYSSIDHQGRYAFANQPPIAHWNMAVLAQALLPLIDAEEEQAVKAAQEAVDQFPVRFQDAYQGVMRRKLGLKETEDEDGALIRDLLQLMADAEADFTGTFRALSEAEADAAGFLTHLGSAGDPWLARWRERLGREAGSTEARRSIMRAANPAIIPRNHRVEAMIEAGLSGDFAPFHAMVEASAQPYEDAPLDGEGAALTRPPKPEEVVHATFCGT